MLVAKLVESDRLQVHDVAYVEGLDPVLALNRLHAQSRPRADLISAFCLQTAQLLKCLERYFKTFLLSHFVLEVLLPLLVVHLRERSEFNLDAVQLLYRNARLLELLQVNFNFFGQVLRAGPVAQHRTVAARPRDAPRPGLDLQLLVPIFLKTKSMDALERLPLRLKRILIRQLRIETVNCIPLSLVL